MIQSNKKASPFKKRPTQHLLICPIPAMRNRRELAPDLCRSAIGRCGVFGPNPQPLWIRKYSNVEAGLSGETPRKSSANGSRGGAQSLSPATTYREKIIFHTLHQI